MGLKKPSTGGGLPSDVVDYSGMQATFAASTTDYDGTNIRMHSKPTEKTLLDTESTVTATAPLSSFGDATEADVAAGKTFTGAAGLFKTGTGESLKNIKVNAEKWANFYEVCDVKTSGYQVVACIMQSLYLLVLIKDGSSVAANSSSLKYEISDGKFSVSNQGPSGSYEIDCYYS